MVDDPRLGQFKIAYHHDTSAHDLQHKFIVATGNKRAVSSKKVRGTKQKKKQSTAARNTVAE